MDWPSWIWSLGVKPGPIAAAALPVGSKRVDAQVAETPAHLPLWQSIASSRTQDELRCPPPGPYCCMPPGPYMSAGRRCRGFRAARTAAEGGAEASASLARAATPSRAPVPSCPCRPFCGLQGVMLSAAPFPGACTCGAGLAAGIIFSFMQGSELMDWSNMREACGGNKRVSRWEGWAAPAAMTRDSHKPRCGAAAQCIAGSS